MKRILFTVGIVALVFASLIAFPAFLHWMALAWILLALAAMANRGPMWPWLIACALLMAIKRPGFTLEFWILVGSLVSVAIVDWRASRDATKVWNTNRWALSAAILLSATTYFGTARWLATNTSVHKDLDNRPIACLGDSLTDSGYPQELAQLLSVPVVDFGRDGIRTDDGIKMIPDILASNPQLAVIELGGHDYNAEYKRRIDVRRNLETLIESFLDKGVSVILMEIPRGFISDPYDGLERELAAQYDLQLIDDIVIRNFVFNSPIVPPGMWSGPSRHYSDDGLHPNALGNKYFAKVVSRALVKVYGDSILK